MNISTRFLKLPSMLIITLLISLNSWALDLQQAKGQGLVGEQYTGYLGAVQSNPPANVKSLISSVNAKRKAKYQQIAKSNKLSLKQVEVRAGERAISKTATGHYIKTQNSNWKKK